MGYKVGPLRREFAMEPGASEHPVVDDGAPRDAQARRGFIEFQATDEAQPRHARGARCKRIEPVEGIDDGRAQVGGGRAFEPKLKEIELDAAATGGGARTARAASMMTCPIMRTSEPNRCARFSNATSPAFRYSSCTSTVVSIGRFAPSDRRRCRAMRWTSA